MTFALSAPPPPNDPLPAEAVDIVYLWVDGSDPTWRSKRQAMFELLEEKEHTDLAIFSNVEGRFRDNQELRFSLRALERYFPRHGHVYIVTDAQVPSWLRTDTKVTIVAHTDLIPSSDLPTFDSGHIESYIHHISGLSERFFYCNDDVFFGAPVNLDHWFLPGGQGVYTSWSDEKGVKPTPMHGQATALENACRFANEWLANTPHYQPTYRTFAHAPRPLLKSVLQQLEQNIPEVFAMVRSTVFRRWDKPSIVSDFVLRWSLTYQKAQLRDYAYRYIATGDADLALKLAELGSQMGALDFFCLNDTLDDVQANDPRLKDVEAKLQQLFPSKSRFEATLITK